MRNPPRRPRPVAHLAAALLAIGLGSAGCEKTVREASRPGPVERAVVLQPETVESADDAAVDLSPAGVAPVSAALSGESAVDAFPAVRSTLAPPKEVIDTETAPCCGGATASARLSPAK